MKDYTRKEIEDIVCQSVKLQGPPFVNRLTKREILNNNRGSFNFDELDDVEIGMQIEDVIGSNFFIADEILDGVETYKELVEWLCEKLGIKETTFNRFENLILDE